MPQQQQSNDEKRKEIADWIYKQARRDLKDIIDELTWLSDKGVANSVNRLIALRVIAKHRYGDRHGFKEEWSRL